MNEQAQPTSTVTWRRAGAAAPPVPRLCWAGRRRRRAGAADEHGEQGGEQQQRGSPIHLRMSSGERVEDLEGASEGAEPRR